MPAILAEIANALAVHGLIPRSGFAFGAEEAAPPGPHGEPARAVLLVGNAGAAYWQEFQEWQAWHPTNIADPLDTWSREVIGVVAETSALARYRPPTGPICPSSNGQCAPRASGRRRWASSCIPNMACGTPIAGRCCSGRAMPLESWTRLGGQLIRRFTFVTYATKNLA